MNTSAHSVNLQPAVESDQGLVLDDALYTISRMRREFDLCESPVLRNSIPAEQSKTLSRLIEEIIVHSSQIYWRHHPLLANLGLEEHDVSEWKRILPQHLRPALRRVFDYFLLTVTELPSRDPTIDSRKQKALKKNTERLVRDLRNHISELERVGGLQLSDHSRMTNLVEELRCLGESLGRAPSKRGSTYIDGPSPEVRLALYFVQWVHSATGRFHYDSVSEIIEAAWSNGNTSAPKWVGRLAIEMHQKRQRRKAFARSLVAGDLDKPTAVSS